MRSGYDLSKAISFCIPLMPSLENAGTCVAGAAMSLAGLPPSEGKHVQHHLLDNSGTHWQTIHEVCYDLVAEGERLFDHCLQGLASSVSAQTGTQWGILGSAGQLLEWCQSERVAQAHKDECMYAAGSAFLSIMEQDIEGLMEACSPLQPLLREECLQGGLFAAGQLQADPSTNRILLDLCWKLIGSRDADTCFYKSLEPRT